jgi:hypothetical protein
MSPLVGLRTQTICHLISWKEFWIINFLKGKHRRLNPEGQALFEGQKMTFVEISSLIQNLS